MAFRYKTDSYKLGHFGMYPDDLEYMFSYFEPRSGSEYDDIVVFGTEYYMTQLQESINAYNYDLKDYARFVVYLMEVYNGWMITKKTRIGLRK